MEGALRTPPGRFDWILRGASTGPNGCFDTDLARFEEAAVIPTRGALIPEWLLVVPRRPYLRVSDMAVRDRTHLIAIVKTVAAHVTEYSGGAVVFEHGPAQRGSASGCGLDQAHLHVVGGKADLLDRLVTAVPEERWLAADHADPWLAIDRSSDYLILRNDERATVAFVGKPTSQRLRKAFADVSGRSAEWDYRMHSCEANARQTVRMFKGAFSPTRA